jgi:hypothetical protein
MTSQNTSFFTVGEGVTQSPFLHLDKHGLGNEPSYKTPHRVTLPLDAVREDRTRYKTPPKPQGFDGQTRHGSARTFVFQNRLPVMIRSYGQPGLE